MKSKIIFTILLITLSAGFLSAQTAEEKREKRKGLTVKEWNENQSTKTKFLDHIRRYDANGYKVEEIEYANYGQKMRITYEYGADGRCIKEVEYDGRDKPVRIRKFEYYPDGSKKKQYNYFPNGKLETIKEFEYIFEK